MAEWKELHIKLAYLLGDLRDNSGTLIEAYDTDGVRYTSKYRSQLLNSGIRWTLNSLDPVFLLQNGIPFGDSGGYLLDWSNKSSSGSITISKMYRLLGVYGTTDSGTKCVIPIISQTNKRLMRFIGNSHWNGTAYCYLANNTTIAVGNYSVYDNIDIFYVKQWEDFTTDQDIGLPLHLQDYVLQYCVAMNNMNSQKMQAGMMVKQYTEKAIQSEKMGIEQTKQVSYNK